MENEIASESKRYHERWNTAIKEASNRRGMLRRYNSLPHDNSYMVRLQLYPSIDISGYKEQKTPIASTEKQQAHSPLTSSSEKKVQKYSKFSSSSKKSANKNSSKKPKQKRKVPWLPVLCCPTICQNIL